MTSLVEGVVFKVFVRFTSKIVFKWWKSRNQVLPAEMTTIVFSQIEDHYNYPARLQIISKPVLISVWISPTTSLGSAPDIGSGMS